MPLRYCRSSSPSSSVIKSVISVSITAFKKLIYFRHQKAVEETDENSRTALFTVIFYFHCITLFYESKYTQSSFLRGKPVFFSPLPFIQVFLLWLHLSIFLSGQQWFYFQTAMTVIIAYLPVAREFKASTDTLPDRTQLLHRNL